MTRQPTTFDKAAMENIPSTLPAPKDSAGSAMKFGTQVPSVVFHSASRATGVNRDHVSVVPTAFSAFTFSDDPVVSSSVGT